MNRRRQADQKRKSPKIEDKIMQIVKTKNRVSTLPRRQSRTTRSKPSISRARRKYRRNTELCSSVSLIADFELNDKEFNEFMHGRAFKVVETNIAVSPVIRNGTNTLFKSIYGINFSFNVSPYKIRVKKYNDSINEAIHQQFNQKLRYIPNLNLKEEIPRFLRPYSQPPKAKVGRKEDPETSLIRELKSEGKSHKAVADILAAREEKRLVKDYVKDGMSETEALNRAKEIVDHNWKLAAKKKSEDAVHKRKPKKKIKHTRN